MIKVFLRGGLGNQMFQYAAGLSLAKKNHTELVLDTTFLNDHFPRPHFVHRDYDLDIFGFTPKFTALSRASSSVPIPGVWLGIDLTLIALRDVAGAAKLVREDREGGFDSTVLAAPKNAVLYGYWQSEKYFKDVEREVRETFRFPHTFSPEAEAFATQIRGCNAVSLAVRRSDYTSAVNIKQFNQIGVDYYDRAIATIALKVPSPHFFIFSDDIAWCKENIKPKFPTTYIPETMRGPKWIWALELSSLCKHQIIANSTFWWWAAWLNQNPQKIVIAPRQWFALRDHDDVVPEEWTRL